MTEVNRIILSIGKFIEKYHSFLGEGKSMVIEYATNDLGEDLNRIIKSVRTDAKKLIKHKKKTKNEPDNEVDITYLQEMVEEIDQIVTKIELINEEQEDL